MSAWNKGHTKATHASVKKISDTMRRKKIDNFATWRDEQRRAGRLRSTYPMPERNGDLAELVGVVLGDGHIERFPRTERLLIVSNSSNAGFVERYARLVEAVLGKAPRVYRQKGEHCTRIDVYEKEISRRLAIPTGARGSLSLPVPQWILADRRLILRYLRGLYEAEGSYSVHAPTYTYKLAFTNHNQSLLKNVEELLKILGLSPHCDHRRVQLSRKEEVMRAVRMLQFREY